LGNFGVLAEAAAKVAPLRGDRKGTGAGHKMEEGLFLDGIDIFGNCFPIDEAEEGPPPVFSDAADSPGMGGYPAAMGAEPASQVILLCFFVQKSFMNHVLYYLP